MFFSRMARILGAVSVGLGMTLISSVAFASVTFTSITTDIYAPRDLATDGTFVWVADATYGVVRIDPANNQTARVALPGPNNFGTPDGIAIEGDYAYTANFNSAAVASSPTFGKSSVSQIQLSTRSATYKWVEIAPVGGTAAALTWITAHNGEVFVAGQVGTGANAKVWRIPASIASGTAIPDSPLPTGVSRYDVPNVGAMAASGNYLYAVSGAGLRRLELSNPAATFDVFVASVGSRGIAISGDFIYVGNSNTVSKVRIADGTVVATSADLGVIPVRLAVGTGTVYVISTTNRLVALDASDLSETSNPYATFSSNNLDDVLVFGDSVWVSQKVSTAAVHRVPLVNPPTAPGGEQSSDPSLAPARQTATNLHVGQSFASSALIPSNYRPTTFTVSPTLPPGLKLNSVTGQITGKPTRLSPVTEYVITGAGNGGSARAVVTISVTPSLAATGVEPVVNMGLIIAALALVGCGGALMYRARSEVIGSR